MIRIIIAFMALVLGSAVASAQPVESFDSFVANFKAKAVAAGVRADVYDAAMGGLTADRWWERAAGRPLGPRASGPRSQGRPETRFRERSLEALPHSGDDVCT